MTHKVLIVEDDKALLEALIDTLELAGIECFQADSAESAILFLKKNTVQLIVSDVEMTGMNGIGLLQYVMQNFSHTPMLLMTAFAEVDKAVEAMKLGAVDYLAKPFSPEVLLNQVTRYMNVHVDSNETIAVSEASLALLDLAKKVARSNASVMISGPSGSGKEVLARFIHQESERAEKPFIAINCAAIPENMLEATLFGYEKGAYTGAHQACPGKFEQAQGGTILLDEISEMDLGLQAKLLRVLQEKEVERLGGRKTISLDVRVLATSNRDLKRYVDDGKFREDLYYRLNVFPLTWLPLKDRRDDILPLAEFILKKHANQHVELSEKAKDKILAHDWPGNVRELENVMQRALIVQSKGTIEAEDIIVELSESNVLEVDEKPSSVQHGTLTDSVRSQEYQVILETLKLYDGRRKDVAEKLGISTRTLRYKLAKMRELGIDFSS